MANLRDYLLQNDQGLGDTVKRVTASIGIKQTEDCKCKDRQKKLNKLVPYNNGVRRHGE